MLTFSETLKQWRASQGYTQEAAAEFLTRALDAAVPLKTYIDWEQGNRQPRAISESAIRKAIQ